MVTSGEKRGVEAAKLFNVDPSTVSKLTVKHRLNDYNS